MFRETGSTLIIVCVVLVLTCATVTAQSESSAEFSDSKQSFQWSSGQGGTLQQPDPYCGDTHENQDKRAKIFSVQRDLGQGVNVRVGISRNGRNNLFAILLFRHNDGLLRLSPDNIELSILGAGALYKPLKVTRTAYIPKNSNCKQAGEWVELEFPVQSTGVKFAELRFPAGIARKDSDLDITPFGFKSAR